MDNRVLWCANELDFSAMPIIVSFKNILCQLFHQVKASSKISIMRYAGNISILFSPNQRMVAYGVIELTCFKLTGISENTLKRNFNSSSV